MHPAVKILVYLIVLLTLNLLNDSVFWLFFIVAIFFAYFLQNKIFVLRCLRLKWLILSILIVYAFGTPGEYLTNTPWQYLPTKEGLYLGFLQSARLLLALSLLSILFYQTKTTQLMLGFYTLLSPLRSLKIDASRFVVRLMLTLDYVDQFTVNPMRKKHFFALLQETQQPIAEQNLQLIRLETTSLRLTDLMTILIAIGYLIFVLSVGQ